MAETYFLRLTIIIVNYNVKHFLEQCLLTVREALLNISSEVIVVDNHSVDGSVKLLEEQFPEVLLIKNHDNKGFAKACNQGLTLAKGDYVLFLNPDTLIPADGLSECLHFMDANSLVGALGVRMLDANGHFLPESKRSFPSLSAAFFKLTGFAFVFPRSAFFNRYALGHLDECSAHDVEVLAGAFFLARKQLLKELGGFDQDFFMYGEDIDLSYRIIKTGYRNRYLGNISITHFKGRSSGRNRIRQTWLFYKAMLIFVRKHSGPGFGYQPILFIQSVIILRAMVDFMFLPFRFFWSLAAKCYLCIFKNPRL